MAGNRISMWRYRGKTPITVENFSGWQRVTYGRAADGSLFGGNFIVNHAAPDSHVILRTDSTGLNTASEAPADQAKLTKAFSDLAAKLYYKDYVHGGDNLAGTLEIAESLTAPSAAKKGYIEFEDGTGKGIYTTERSDLPFTAVNKFDDHTDERAIGKVVGEDSQETWEGNTLVNVSGVSVAKGRKNHYVTGILLDEGGQLTVNGDLKVRVKNTAPATQGDTATAATAHYRMSGIYAALGGRIGNDVDGYEVMTIRASLSTAR